MQNSPFLLTCIVSIAAKYHAKAAEYEAQTTAFVKETAFGILATGCQNVEIVQGFILLALYGTGQAERYEEDRLYMYSGFAIRMATDLNLHRKSAPNSKYGLTSEENALRMQEIHVRERTW